VANDIDSAKYGIDTHGSIQGAVIGDNNTVTLIYQSGAQRSVPFLAPSPAHDHSIVGHEQLLKDLKASLFAGKSQALVVLPGVGNTTLAIEAAKDKKVLQHFPDGVLWVSLGRRPDVLAELKGWARALAVSENDLAKINTKEDACNCDQRDRGTPHAAGGGRRVAILCGRHLPAGRELRAHRNLAHARGRNRLRRETDQGTRTGQHGKSRPTKGIRP
jgi:hypothetical protein